MDRLTYKDDNDYKLLRGRECQWKKKIKEEYETIDNSIQKLGKLEDIEEELGCPLDVYVKATINGIVVDGETFKVKVRKDNNGYYFALSNGSAFPFYLSSYKKTWWLKEDRSE